MFLAPPENKGKAYESSEKDNDLRVVFVFLFYPNDNDFSGISQCTPTKNSEALCKRIIGPVINL